MLKLLCFIATSVVLLSTTQATTFCTVISENEKVERSIDTIEIVREILYSKYPKYRLIKIQKGDINKDNKEDVVAILEKNCEETNEHGLGNVKCRKAVFLTQQDFPSYVIATSNNYVIDCSNCGGVGKGDPLRKIIIEDGCVSFESHYGICNETLQKISFTYDPRRNDWFFYKRETNNYSCSSKKNQPKPLEVLHKEDLGGVSFKLFK